VVAVGTVLRQLLDRNMIRTFEPPSAPTPDELRRLSERLGEEIDSATFGDSMQRLALYIQIQEGLGDELGGAVEVLTAQRLNTLATRAFGEPAAGPPPELVRVAAFSLSFTVSSRAFRLRYRLDGETMDRSRDLTPTVATALLAMKSSARYFVFSPATMALVATDDLLH